MAEDQGWTAVEAEITKQMEFGPRIAQLARRALLGIAPRGDAGRTARRAAGILKSFTLTVSTDGALSAALDIEPVEGVADSGDLANDLTDLFVALGEAARDQGTGVVFLFDEIQFLTRPQFEALIAALHKTVQRALPVTLVGAGLPQIPRLAGEAKSYAERLFTFPQIGPLAEADAVEALAAPARELGVDFTARGDRRDRRLHAGRYPYFIQEYGKIVWDEAEESPISLKTVRAVLPLVEAKLDGSFFRVRIERGHAARYALPEGHGRLRRRPVQGERRSRRARTGLRTARPHTVPSHRQRPALHARVRTRSVHRPAVRPLPLSGRHPCSDGPRAEQVRCAW